MSRVPGALQPELGHFAGVGLGVSFIECDTDLIPLLTRDVAEELRGHGAVQVVSPVKGGLAGTRNYNEMCHQDVAGKQSALGFAIGEPVIWLANNYDLNLMNGSLGVVRRIQDGCPVVAWDDCELIMDDVSDMDLAYAITVHKSQGSQWNRVIVPVFGSRLLDRTLLYTAITRAQSQVVLVGDRAAFERAVSELPSSSRRETGMRWWLKNAA